MHEELQRFGYDFNGNLLSVGSVASAQSTSLTVYEPEPLFVVSDGGPGFEEMTTQVIPIAVGGFVAGALVGGCVYDAVVNRENCVTKAWNNWFGRP